MTRWNPLRFKGFHGAWGVQRATVMAQTRLDTVVRLREREEERAGQAVAKAESQVRAAMERRDAAHARQMQEFGGRLDASHWETAERARNRALLEEQQAEREVDHARKVASQVRAAYLSAHQRAEVVRRVADSRQKEAVREENRTEARQLDDVAGILFVRKAG